MVSGRTAAPSWRSDRRHPPRAAVGGAQPDSWPVALGCQRSRSATRPAACRGASRARLTMDDRGYRAQALFDQLQSGGMPFCVLGDARLYPQALPSDIDRAAPRAALQHVAPAVSHFCRDYDLHLVQMLRHEQTACYFVLAWTDEVGRPRFLAADFCSDYYRHGRLLLGAEELLARRRPAIDGHGEARGLDGPPPAGQFIYYLLKKTNKRGPDGRHGGG